MNSFLKVTPKVKSWAVSNKGPYICHKYRHIPTKQIAQKRA